jgi:hypothetical protein
MYKIHTNQMGTWKIELGEGYRFRTGKNEEGFEYLPYQTITKSSQ